MSSVHGCEYAMLLALLVLSRVSSYRRFPVSRYTFLFHSTRNVAPLITKSTALPNTTPAPVILTRDLYAAGYERPHPELCPMLGTRLRLLVLVMSAPQNNMAREAVRLTWGHYAARADVAIGFMLGEPPNNLRAAIDAEDALYGDIIIGHSVDSYSNLTLKTLSMLQWTDTYCPRAPFMLKTDDDMFINIQHLLEWIAAPERANAKRTIWGKIITYVSPDRNTNSKYYMSPVQYPATVYPDYVTGASYLLTTDLVRPLLQAAPSLPYMRIEDAFVTGVLGKYVGLTHIHEPTFVQEKSEDPCVVQRAIAILEVTYVEQFSLWSKQFDKCTS